MLNDCEMLDGNNVVDGDNVLNGDNVLDVVYLEVCEPLLLNGRADLLGIKLLEL